MTAQKRPGIQRCSVSRAGGVTEWRYFVKPKALGGSKSLGSYATFEEASTVLDAYERDGTIPARKKTGPPKKKV